VSKGKQLFRETELTRAIRAAKKEGLTVSKVKVNTQGEIEIEVGQPTAASYAVDNEWDSVLPNGQAA
jgi:hypothetical protein